MSKTTFHLYKIIVPTLLLLGLFSFDEGENVVPTVVKSDSLCNDVSLKYAKLNLMKHGLTIDAFEKAYVGWLKLNEQSKLSKKGILAIADL